MPSNFQSTSAWFAAAGKAKTPENFSTQVGVHISEFVEMLRELTLVSNTGLASAALVEIADVLDGVATTIVSGNAHVIVHDKVEFLDSLCDQNVTLDGIAYLAGFDKDGADNEVQRSNFSKFEDGVALIAPGGKIMKGKEYSPADLTPFVPAESDVVDAEVPHEQR